MPLKTKMHFAVLILADNPVTDMNEKQLNFRLKIIDTFLKQIYLSIIVVLMCYFIL